ncbi:MAG: YkgJ family cysteine cluster protein [Candidatus Woesearchaeota archaeon]
MIEVENCLSCCTTCGENCCHTPKISSFIGVNLEDARRIKAHTNLDYAKFLTFTPLTSKVVKELVEEVKKSQDTESSLRLRLLTSQNRLLRIKSLRGRCYFLNQENRCTIYEISPGICKLYPYWYKKDQEGELTPVLHEGGHCCALSHKYLDPKNLPLSERETLIEHARKVESGNEDYLAEVEKFTLENNIRRN